MFWGLTILFCHSLSHRCLRGVARSSSRRRLPLWTSAVAITLAAALTTVANSANSKACNLHGLEYGTPQPMTVDWFLFTQTLERTFVSTLKEDGTLIATLETTHEQISEPLRFLPRRDQTLTSISDVTFGIRYNAERTIMWWQTQTPSEGFAVIRGAPPLAEKVRIIVNDAAYNWIVTDLLYVVPRTPTEMLADVACFLTSQPSKE